MCVFLLAETVPQMLNNAININLKRFFPLDLVEQK